MSPCHGIDAIVHSTRSCANKAGDLLVSLLLLVCLHGWDEEPRHHVPPFLSFAIYIHDAKIKTFASGKE
jgi:hypothetical protein